MENEKNNSEQEAGEMMHASNANTFTVGCGMMYADRTEVLEFGANRYKKLQMVLQGYYTVQIIDMPSQHFAVKINGKPIYGKDLVGKDFVEYDIPSSEFDLILKVEVVLTKANMASSAAGSISITLIQ